MNLSISRKSQYFGASRLERARESLLRKSLVTTGFALILLSAFSQSETKGLGENLSAVAKILDNFTSRDNTPCNCRFSEVDSVVVKQAQVVFFSWINSSNWTDSPNDFDYQVCKIGIELGRFSIRKKDYRQAYDYFEKSGERLEGNDPVKAEIYFYQGLADEYMGKFDEAISFHQMALAIYKQLPATNYSVVARLYQRIGANFGNLQDLQQAQSYFELALSYCGKDEKQDPNLLRTIYYDLGKEFNKQRRLDEAVAMFSKAKEIVEKEYGESNKCIADIYQSLASNYFKKGQFKEAASFFEKSEKSYSASCGNEYNYLSFIYTDLGRLQWRYLNEYTKAFENFEKSLRILKLQHGEKFYAIGDIYFEMAEASFIHHDLTNALENTQRAFIAYLTDFNQADVRINPDMTQIRHSITHNANFLGALLLKAKALAATQEQIPDNGIIDENLVENTLGLAKDCFQYLRENLKSEGSRSSFSEIFKFFFEGTIDLLSKIPEKEENKKRIESIFSLVELSRALLLFDAFQKSEANLYGEVPSSVLLEEEKLSKKIQELKYQITYPRKGSDQGVLLDSLLGLKMRLSKFETDLERNYPNYYRLKYDIEPVSLAVVQGKLLQPYQTFLEYFIADTSIFAVVIGKDKKEFIRIPANQDFNELVRQLREGITADYENGYSGSGAGLEIYIRSARKLYDLLIAPIRHLLTRELIIVPDGPLGYLPFEALLSGEPADIYSLRTFPFLIREYTISYCYSATLLMEMQQKTHTSSSNKSLLAMAPFYTKSRRELEISMRKELPETLMRVDTEAIIALRGGLGELPKSGEEAYLAARIFNGAYLIHQEATKKQFLEHAPQYRMLLLSTHGVADNRRGDYSYLAFAPETESAGYDRLFVRDLYNLQINADLVTLSACESGVGELQRGEGIISMARAFAYAGAKSIVTTLWVADDAATKDLIVFFYKELEKGLPKDAALRNAKLWYLENGPEDKQDPFFWAGFIPIGDMSPLK